jgi:transcription elongation factor Elf1
MGSVLDFKECPHCGNEATSDYYYKTDEEYIHCIYCGYYKSITIKDDWQVIEIDNPFGAYRIKTIGAIGTRCGTIMNEEDYEILKKEVMDDEPQIEYFAISRFINGDIDTKIIINKKN